VSKKIGFVTMKYFKLRFLFFWCCW